VERADYRGWQSLRLANDLVTLHVVPDIGGRVIQFQLGEHPFLWVNPDLAGNVFPPAQNGGGEGGWKNYGGSKLWPAPQGWERDDQWPGPPDPVLDGGRYTGQILDDSTNHVAVAVTSPPDPRSGIQFTRTISLEPGSTRVRLAGGMRNISQRPLHWAIWEVTQLDTGDPRSPEKFNDDFWAYCPLNPRSVHPKGFYPMFGQVTHPSWRPDPANGLLAVKYDHRVGKVGLDSHAGWLAAVNGQSDHCFVGRFRFFPDATYPDNASVEFWLNGAGEFIINGVAFTNAPSPKETPFFMEAEILSPLVELQPGESYHFDIDWFATRCPKPILEMASAGVVSRRLTVTVEGGRVRLDGVFGVFCRGRAEVIFKDRFGNIVGREDLGAVNPNEVFRLAKQLRLPEQSLRVTVVVIDAAGENRGWLGNAILAQP
jgi:hypothetical protein